MSLGQPHIPHNEAVRVFLTGLFDYAGLFPPASLTLEDAISEYAQYRMGSDKWMIGPFVCHVSSLDDLDAFGRLFEKSPPFQFSILTRTADDSTDFSLVLQEDLEEMNRFVKRHSGNVSTDIIEVRVPRVASADRKEAGAILSDLGALETGCPLIPDSVFLEVSRDEDFAVHLENVASAIAFSTEISANMSGDLSGKSFPRVGLKLRCGGTNPLDFPTPGQIAEFLKTVIRHRVQFKATAGLHHPVRHVDCKSGFIMHGFLNVFFAAALDAVHDVDVSTMIQVLEEMDADAFAFSDDGIRWRDWAISTKALAQIRERLASSIGSCSFDEPRADLVSLDWLSTESVVTSENTSD